MIVVDEFAALLGDHPELHAVFTDVAARGRALGMHLILGTQRVAGVVRDALLANCPLRVSLRVTDASDSRAVIGSDEAARLPGGAEGAGIAFVRRGSDAAPRRIRVALSAPADVERICASPSGPRPRRPWLPDLPERVELDELMPGVGAPGVLTLGLADEPDRQRQVPVALRIADRGVLVLGRAGSGRSTALRTLASQAAHAVTVPADPEAAWDVLAMMDEAPPPPGTVVSFDDLDALIPRYPHDYGLEVVERVEQLIRGAGDHEIFVAVSMQRPAGAIGRAVELLPRRILLAATSRAEHLAFGGDASHHAIDQPPGRARFDGRAVQIAVTPAGARHRGRGGRLRGAVDADRRGHRVRRPPVGRHPAPHSKHGRRRASGSCPSTPRPPSSPAKAGSSSSASLTTGSVSGSCSRRCAASAIS